MNQMRSEIADIVTEINPAVVVPADKAGESLFDLGLDSLDHASILLAVEEKYGIKIPDEETNDLVTIDALAGYVSSKAG